MSNSEVENKEKSRGRVKVVESFTKIAACYKRATTVQAFKLLSSRVHL